MTTILEHCFAITVGTEGGLSLDPNDPGNWTGGRIGDGELRGSKFGVSAKSYPELDIANLTLEDAARLFEQDYFLKAQCHLVPGPLACLMADAAYNNGPARPVRWLQQALGVHVDGQIGKQTLQAVQDYHARGFQLLIRFQAIRLRFMASLAGWQHNTGWADRLFTVMLAATVIPEHDA